MISLAVAVMIAAQEPAQKEAAPAPDEKRVKCKTERATGTLGAKPIKICKTVSGWEQTRRDSRELTEKWQRSNTGMSGN